MHAPTRPLVVLSAVAAFLFCGAGEALATHSSGASAELVALIGDPATHAVFVATPASHDWDWPDCSTVLVVDLTRPPHTPVAGPRTEPDADADIGEEPAPRETWVPGCVAHIVATPAPLRWLPESAAKRWQIEHFDDLEGFVEGHEDDPAAMPDTARVAVPSIFGHTGTIAPAGFRHLRVELVEEDVRRDVCMFPYDVSAIPADEIPPECFAPGCPSCTGDACQGTCAYPEPDDCPDPCESCVTDVITYRLRVTDTRTGASTDGTRFVASAETLTQAEMVCPDKSPVEMALNQLAVHETETVIIVYGAAIHGWMYNDTSIPVIAVLPKGAGLSAGTPAPAAGCGSCQGGTAGGAPEGFVGMLIVFAALMGLSSRRSSQAH